MEKKRRLECCWLAKEQDSSSRVSSNCSWLPQHIGAAQKMMTPAVGFVMQNIESSCPSNSSRRRNERRPQGSGRCVAESKRVGNRSSLIRQNVPEFWFTYRSYKISFLSRNGQHGMIQWIAVWFLPEAEGDV